MDMVEHGSTRRTTMERGLEVPARHARVGSLICPWMEAQVDSVQKQKHKGEIFMCLPFAFDDVTISTYVISVTTWSMSMSPQSTTIITQHSPPPPHSSRLSRE
jgi:hypothetical protein